MYLWKYWRESRIVSTIGLLCLTAAVLLTCMGKFEAPTDPRELSKLAAVFLYVQLAPVGLLAWLMGGFGVGRDLGDGSGSFPLTRPRLRRWFSWRDWGFGLAHIAAAIVALNLLFGYALHRLAGVSGGALSGALPFQDKPAPIKIAYLMSLNCLTLLLFGRINFRCHVLLDNRDQTRTGCHAGRRYPDRIPHPERPTSSLLACPHFAQPALAGIQILDGKRWTSGDYRSSKT